MAIKPNEQSAKPSIPQPKKGERLQSVRGMKDILPQDERMWGWITDHARTIARAYGFQFIQTPILEETSLFVRAVGKETDIVEKEMFSFVDQGGEHLSLRPEFTAGIVRAYVEHGMLNQPQPVQLVTIGPVFRHERPQAGRLRQHHQFNCEVLGDASAVSDAQLIMLAFYFYKGLGIDVTVHVNSVGCPQCRPAYTEDLQRYYKAHRKSLCEDCQRRLVKNPLRVLDCKEESCKPIVAGAPQMLDRLCEECKNHFMKALEYLDDGAIPYNLAHYLVRGLDYYTKTVFEFTTASPDGTESLALGGGGRYDGLVEQLSGRACPAAGFGIGLERVITTLRSRMIEPPTGERPQVFLAQLGDAAKRRAILLFEECRRVGLTVLANFAKDSLKVQLELARKARVRYTIIIGQKEVMEGTMLLRDMDGGSQEVVNAERIIHVLTKKLERAPADVQSVGAPGDAAEGEQPAPRRAREDWDGTGDADEGLGLNDDDGSTHEESSDADDAASFEKGGDSGGSETETE